MQTYSHWLIGRSWAKRRREQGKPVAATALQVGAMAPDFALVLLSVNYMYQQRFGGDQVCSDSYDDNYFGNPVWITGHSLLHAPFSIAVMVALGWLTRRSRWGEKLFWFGVGCASHTLIDIPTHHNDGPLLGWPFNKVYRFNSPVSYWNREHYGGIFMPLEHLLDLGLVVYLFFRRRRN